MKTLTEFSFTLFQKAFRRRLELLQSGVDESVIRQQIETEFPFTTPKSNWFWAALINAQEDWVHDLAKIVIVHFDIEKWAPYYAVDAGDYFILYTPTRPIPDPGHTDERIPYDDHERLRRADEEWLSRYAERTGGRVPKRLDPK